MVSAIVLATGEAPAPADAQELALRSLVWLVSAVVAGTVRDVVVACPSNWPIADAMEQAGCDLVVADGEAARVAAAAVRVKCERVLLLRIGLQPEGPLVAELDAAILRMGAEDTVILREAPMRWHERLFPALAPTAGLLLPREMLLRAAAPFSVLARETRGRVARTRMVRVLEL